MHGRLLAATALAGILAVSGCGDSSELPSKQTTPPENPATTPPVTISGVPTGVQVTQLTVGPVGIAAVDGAAWTALPGPGEVRLADDRRTRVGTAPLRLVTTPYGVWVSVIGDGKLVRIDSATGKVDLRVRLAPPGSEPEGLAYDGTSVWVVDQAHDRIVPLDPRSGQLGRPVDVGLHPRLVDSGPSGLWVGNYDGGSVSKVTGDGTVTTKSVDKCSTPQGVVEAAGVVWVACTVDSRVVGLDVRTLEVVAKFDGLGSADAVVASGDTVYAVGQQGPTVWTIDATAKSLSAKLTLDHVGATTENVDAAVIGGHLVVTHPNVFRIYDVPLSLLAP